MASTEDLASAVALAYKAATGGDGKLSGTGKARRGSGKAAPVSAKAKDVRRYSTGSFVGLVVPTGPYGLIERNIAPHSISVYRTSSRRRNSILRKARKAAYAEDRSAVAATRAARAGIAAKTARALSIPGSPSGFAMSANHPGTKGRDIMDSASRAAGGFILKGLDIATRKQIVQGYRTG